MKKIVKGIVGSMRAAGRLLAGRSHGRPAQGNGMAVIATASRKRRRVARVDRSLRTRPVVRFGTRFAAPQARDTFPQQWHALAEYRALKVKDGGTRSGFLVGIDRDITKNLRIGVGYNFTDFSDDLTTFDHTHRGWFLNLVGSY